ncbi:hypothetical protein DQ04_15141020 [Trypanosoma grayi]|uniref:hypothetical protein n=1 Tax=Trypanosoma grayi TaxID=71804 RepID=UPI0004F49515|nr:hypothetical protein DQ04_15141020 [Trypanosoma grayi]KEG06227.1 hypothetical protein DQ04_15141020 [Trypanosoma grayi]
MSSVSKGGLSSAGGNPLAVLMTDMFAPLPLQQRWKTLLLFAERWRVSLPSKPAGDKKDACREVIGRLAVKMGRVISRKAEVQQGGQDIGLGTLRGSIDMRRSSRLSRVSLTSASITHECLFAPAGSALGCRCSTSTNTTTINSVEFVGFSHL